MSQLPQQTTFNKHVAWINAILQNHPFHDNPGVAKMGSVILAAARKNKEPLVVQKNALPIPVTFPLRSYSEVAYGIEKHRVEFWLLLRKNSHHIELIEHISERVRIDNGVKHVHTSRPHEDEKASSENVRAVHVTIGIEDRGDHLEGIRMVVYGQLPTNLDKYKLEDDYQAEGLIDDQTLGDGGIDGANIAV